MEAARGHREPASRPVVRVGLCRCMSASRASYIGRPGRRAENGNAEARRSPAGGLTIPEAAQRGLSCLTSRTFFFPRPGGGCHLLGAPLDHSRRHSPHYRVHHRNSDSLDDRHHCPRGRRDPRVARDGRSRGRRTQTLLLAAGPDAGCCSRRQGASRWAWVAIQTPRVRLCSRRVACWCCAAVESLAARRHAARNAKPGEGSVVTVESWPKARGRVSPRGSPRQGQCHRGWPGVSSGCLEAAGARSCRGGGSAGCADGR